MEGISIASIESELTRMNLKYKVKTETRTTELLYLQPHTHTYSNCVMWMISGAYNNNTSQSYTYRKQKW